MTCSVCNNTGRRPGSEFLDCTEPGCNAAEERAELERVVANWQKRGKLEEVDLIWRVYRLGIGVGFINSTKGQQA